MKRARLLSIGSISSGTLRPEDLIPAFLAEAQALRLSRHDRKQVASIAREFDVYDEDAETSQDACLSDLVDELSTILEQYTPDYCYFGTSEGDGAEFGVWPVSELFTDSTQGSYDGCVYRMAMGGDFPRGNYSHALAINDHGNCTLYRRLGTSNRWREVWSIV